MKSVKVKRVDRSIQKLIDDMIETMRDAEGIGLAAPQIGVLLRVVVCEYADDETEELHQTVLINPEIINKEGEWMAEEGCLSIPGYVGTVPRAVKVTVKGKDRNGKDVKIKTDGALAHIVQHETDHLDGVLYIDYLDSMDELREVEPNRKRRRRRRTPDEEAEGVPVVSEETAGEALVGDTAAPEESTNGSPGTTGGSSAPPAQDEPVGRARRRYRPSSPCGLSECCPPDELS
jgi:peptide deformylase